MCFKKHTCTHSPKPSRSRRDRCRQILVEAKTTSFSRSPVKVVRTLTMISTSRNSGSYTPPFFFVRNLAEESARVPQTTKPTSDPIKADEYMYLLGYQSARLALDNTRPLVSKSKNLPPHGLIQRTAAAVGESRPRRFQRGLSSQSTFPVRSMTT